MPPKKSKAGGPAGLSRAHTSMSTPTKQRGAASFGSPSSMGRRAGGPSPGKKTGNKDIRVRVEDVESFLPSNISAYMKGTEVCFLAVENLSGVVAKFD